MSEQSNQSSSNKAEFSVRVTGRPSAHYDDWNVIEVPLAIMPGDIPLSITVEYDDEDKSFTLIQHYAGRESSICRENVDNVNVLFGGHTGRVYTMKFSNCKLDSRLSPLWEGVREKIALHADKDRRAKNNIDFFSDILNSSISRFRRKNNVVA